MRKPEYIEIEFPTKGLSVTTSRRAQPDRSTIDCRNVRPYDYDGRMLGGQRDGLSRYCSAQISGANRIQDINHVITVPTAGAAPGVLNVRTLNRIAVCNGNILKFTTGAAAAPGTGSETLNASAPVVFSSSLYDVLYLVDGTNNVKYDIGSDTTSDWEADAEAHVAGTTFPEGTSTHHPRLIATWNGRIVLSGIKSDPQNWFMSAKGDPLDFDYSPTVTVETQAVAGNNSTAGQTADPITCLIPYSNDILLFGTDSELWQMSGDPMAGGRLDRISDITGVAWGRPFCKSPAGLVYFFGSRGGVYRMIPGSGVPERISAGSIEPLISAIDMDANIIRMAWDDKKMGVHILITPLDSTAAGDGYFYDARTEGFFRDSYETDNAPVAVHVVDGDDPSDRAILFGSENGYINQVDDDATNDISTAIRSYIYLGPIQVEYGQVPFVVSELQAVLAADSSDVDAKVYVGSSPEDAADISGYVINKEGSGLINLIEGGSLILTEGSTDETHGAAFELDFEATRSYAKYARKRAYTVFVKVYNNNTSETWSLSSLKAKLNVITSSKRRQKV